MENVNNSNHTATGHGTVTGEFELESQHTQQQASNSAVGGGPAPQRRRYQPIQDVLDSKVPIAKRRINVLPVDNIPIARRKPEHNDQLEPREDFEFSRPKLALSARSKRTITQVDPDDIPIARGNIPRPLRNKRVQELFADEIPIARGYISRPPKAQELIQIPEDIPIAPRRGLLVKNESLESIPLAKQQNLNRPRIDSTIDHQYFINRENSPADPRPRPDSGFGPIENEFSDRNAYGHLNIIHDIDEKLIGVVLVSHGHEAPENISESDSDLEILENNDQLTENAKHPYTARTKRAYSKDVDDNDMPIESDDEIYGYGANQGFFEDDENLYFDEEAAAGDFPELFDDIIPEIADPNQEQNEQMGDVPFDSDEDISSAIDNFGFGVLSLLTPQEALGAILYKIKLATNATRRQYEEYRNVHMEMGDPAVSLRTIQSKLELYTGIKHTVYDICPGPGHCFCFAKDPTATECPVCGTARIKAGPGIKSFDYISVAHTLKLQYASKQMAHELKGYRIALDRNQKESGESTQLRDFRDGKLAKKLRSEGMLTKGTDVAFYFSTDGVQLFRKGKFHYEIQVLVHVLMDKR